MDYNPIDDPLRILLTKRIMEGHPEQEIADEFNMTVNCVKSIPNRRWFKTLAVEHLERKKQEAGQIDILTMFEKGLL